jgi:hypothetical protein
MRLLVCGGRHYRDERSLRRVLDAALRTGDLTLIAGGARGADRLARQWAVDRGVPCATYPADWDQHGPAAGSIRNQQMLDDGRPDMVLAFPGGRGTADMVERAHRKGVLVVNYPPLDGQRSPFGLD